MSDAKESKFLETGRGRRDHGPSPPGGSARPANDNSRTRGSEASWDRRSARTPSRALSGWETSCPPSARLPRVGLGDALCHRTTQVTPRRSAKDEGSCEAETCLPQSSGVVYASTASAGPRARPQDGRRPATYLSVSCHDQRSGGGGLGFAARHRQGGGQAGQQGSGRLQAELVDAGRRAGRRVGILQAGTTAGS